MVATSSVADYQSGYDAWLSGDYGTAMSEWKAVAATTPQRNELATYREALYGIGMLYWQGHGVNQDYSVATVWLKQAADINHPDAQNKLGYLYSMGLGVPQNFEEAAKWFGMAAAQGDADAQRNLEALESQGLVQAGAGAGLAAGESGSGDSLEIEAGAETEVVPELIEVTSGSGQDFGEDWIRRQDPEHYTIQVIALSAPDKLHDFMETHADWSPFALYRQTRYEKPLWVMVQGDYPDVESARAARDAFPAGIQKRQDLWIRKFGMVQRLLE